jgi:CubicO group peptidase (beta-lactamase class C family)
MNKRRTIFLLLIIAFGLYSFAQQPHYFVANGKKVNIKEFNKRIANAMDDIGIPGVSLAIIDHDSVVFSNAYGYVTKGGEKLNRETIFEACSLSKTFLVYLVYKMVDKGLLDLDKPMYKYMRKENFENMPGYQLITPRMILSHCSGIENWREMNNPDSLEIVAFPGTSYVYSGEGYHYLAEVMEMLIKEPYERTVKRVVLTPLHLNRTFTSYAKDNSSPLNYAIGHTIMGDTIPKKKNYTPVPAAGVHTTPEDYANLIIAICNGKYVSAARIKDMLTPSIRLIDTDSLTHYGPGFEVIYSPHDTLICHEGANAGFRNVFFYSVRNKRGFVLMTNHEWGKKLAELVSRSTVELDITTRTHQYSFEDQYPDNASRLLNIYRKKGVDAMLANVEQLRQKNKLSMKNMVELSYAFAGKDDKINKMLLDENVAYFPASIWPYMELGYYYYERNDFGQAYKYFSRIKEIDHTASLVDFELKVCEEKKGQGIK